MKRKVLNIGLILLVNLIFVGVANAQTYSNYSDVSTSCGGGILINIPKALPQITSIAYTLIQIAVPVVLVIMGMLDLFKGITAQKEDEIEKARKMFINRLIAAATVFFVFVIVKVIISAVADKNSTGIIGCAECFVKNSCD